MPYCLLASCSCFCCCCCFVLWICGVASQYTTSLQSYWISSCWPQTILPFAKLCSHQASWPLSAWCRCRLCITPITISKTLRSIKWPGNTFITFGKSGKMISPLMNFTGWYFEVPYSHLVIHLMESSQIPLLFKLQIPVLNSIISHFLLSHNAIGLFERHTWSEAHEVILVFRGS